MAKPLDKQALVRAAWVTALRQRGNRVCNVNEDCALMILADVAGDRWSLLDDVACAVAGLTKEQAWEVIAMNDGRESGPKFWFAARKDRPQKTFTQMADVIEGWSRA